MKVLIFSAFEPIPSDSMQPLRYGKIAEYFSKDGHEVTYITSSFFHLHKKQRISGNWPDEEAYRNISVELIPAPAYRSHKGARRIFNHLILAANLRKYLRQLKKPNYPDLIISAYPPVSANYVLSKWAVKKNIQIFLDLQDIWPLNFKQFVPVLGDLLLTPLKLQFLTVLRNTTAISAVSDDYLSLAKKEAGPKPTRTFYLGADMNAFAGKSSKEPTDTFKIIYTGSATTNKLLNSAIEAVAGMQGVSLQIIGTSHTTPELEAYAKTKGVSNVTFIPWLPFDDLVKETMNSDAALLLVNNNSLIAFPYKAYTYFAAGLPVVNNIREGELEKVISEGELGITISNDSVDSIREAIEALRLKFTLERKKSIQQFARKNFDSNTISERYYQWIMEVYTAMANFTAPKNRTV